MLFNGQPVRQNLFTQRIQQEGGFTVNRSTAIAPTRWPKSPVAASLAKMTGAFMVGEVYAVTGAVSTASTVGPNPLWRLQIAHRTTNGVGVITLHIAIFFGNYTAGERMTR